MSGLVVGYGSPNSSMLEEMFKKIGYRGPHLSGIWENQNVMMAQNYLKADCPAAHPQKTQVPVTSPRAGNSRI